jgi:hypothetical protein
VINRPENSSKSDVKSASPADVKASSIAMPDVKSASPVDAKASSMAQFEGMSSVFQEGEHISHTFAYRRDLAAGKITLLDKPYQLVIPVTTPGLVCYVLIPEAPSTEIKVVFRGTKDAASVFSDLEPEAPGAESYLKSQNAILAAINEAIKVVGNRVSISIYGHSLGGAYAQNCYTDLMKKINKSLPEKDETLDVAEDNYFKNITALTLSAFNSAGVTKHVASKARQLAHSLKRKGVKLTCLWQHVAGDLVQQTGRASILSDASHDVAAVHVLKVHYEQAPESVWKDTYNLFQAVSAFQNTMIAHTNHCHRLGAPPSRLEYYVNDKAEDEVRIHSMLSRKNGLLQNTLIQWVQVAVGFIAARKYGLVVDAPEVSDSFVVLQTEEIHGSVGESSSVSKSFEFIKNGEKPVVVSLPVEVSQISENVNDSKLSIAQQDAKSASSHSVALVAEPVTQMIAVPVADLKLSDNSVSYVESSASAARSVDKISVTNKKVETMDTRKTNEDSVAQPAVSEAMSVTLSSNAGEIDATGPAVVKAVSSVADNIMSLSPLTFSESNEDDVHAYVWSADTPISVPKSGPDKRQVLSPARSITPLSVHSETAPATHAAVLLTPFDWEKETIASVAGSVALSAGVPIPAGRMVAPAVVSPSAQSEAAPLTGSNAVAVSLSSFNWQEETVALVAGSVALSAGVPMPAGETMPPSTPPARRAVVARIDVNASEPTSNVNWKYIATGMAIGALVAIGIALAVGTYGVGFLVLAGIVGVMGGSVLGRAADAIRQKFSAPSVVPESPRAYSPAVVRSAMTPTSSYSQMLNDLGAVTPVTPLFANKVTVAVAPTTPTPPKVQSSSWLSCLEDCASGMQAMSQVGVLPSMPGRYSPGR